MIILNDSTALVIIKQSTIHSLNSSSSENSKHSHFKIHVTLVLFQGRMKELRQGECSRFFHPIISGSFCLPELESHIAITSEHYKVNKKNIQTEWLLRVLPPH